MLASKQGDYNIVSYILNKSTLTINDKNNEGYTALLLASKYGHSEICNILIQNNANTTLLVNGNNANMLAAKNGFNNVKHVTKDNSHYICQDNILIFVCHQYLVLNLNLFQVVRI